jgi:acetylornithine deacetylase/succinyl-diaminopimelate desuccinylase-like protein
MSNYRDALDVEWAARNEIVSGIREEIDAHDQAIIDQQDIMDIEDGAPALGIDAEVVDIDVHWREDGDNIVRLTVMLTDLNVTEDGTEGVASFGKYIDRPIADEEHALHYVIAQRLEEAVAARQEIEEKVSRLYRKEEQVRAAILDLRLRSAELGHLIDHESVRELVTL